MTIGCWDIWWKGEWHSTSITPIWHNGLSSSLSCTFLPIVHKILFHLYFITESYLGLKYNLFLLYYAWFSNISLWFYLYLSFKYTTFIFFNIIFITLLISPIIIFNSSYKSSFIHYIFLHIFFISIIIS